MGKTHKSDRGRSAAGGRVGPPGAKAGGDPGDAARFERHSGLRGAIERAGYEGRDAAGASERITEWGGRGSAARRSTRALAESRGCDAPGAGNEWGLLQGSQGD